MTWDLGQAPSQKGKTAVVTGANIGLGYETAAALAGKEMTVVLACRNLEKAEAAKAKILSGCAEADLQVMHLDLSSLKSVRAFADDFLNQHQSLHLLINNAGIMMPPFSLTEDGFESQLGANYLGHFALTGFLLPLLEKEPGARIVTLSSMAHDWANMQFDDLHFKKKYNARKAYGQSKLACLIFAYELQRRLKSHGHRTLSMAAHPGASNTNLAQHLPKILHWMTPLVTQSAVAGTQPTLMAALDTTLKGGEYTGPDGFKQFYGKPVVVGSNRASRDQETARRLWEASEQLTDVHYL